MNGTADYVITCTGSDLLSFESFIERQERNRVGWEKGFFKVVIDPSTPRQTASSSILEKVTKNLKKVDIQYVLRGTAENIHQFKSSPANIQTLKEFKNIGLTSFSEETCCLQELKTGTDHLVAHYFNHLAKSEATFSLDCTTLEEKKEHYLREGAKLRKLYEDDRLDNNKPGKSDKTDQNCSCPDCIPESKISLTTHKDSIYYGSGVVLPDSELILINGFSLSTIKKILKIGPYHEGLSCSYFYMGRKHSFFPLHVEDALLWSINYLHFGLPKIWYNTALQISK
ncbi:Lysine-specific demethylase 4D [Frankliniella fusca]|uniref:Lysine-specific demethylase 4D n=1 Tax=Frankliniella fusca TaxID=407009 RepID=A0AAE1H081_9NEOP|nr:Lysine-specific demethylase 4D [Frankliniella fusca]